MAIDPKKIDEDLDDKKFRARMHTVPVQRVLALEEISAESTGISNEDLPKVRDFWD